jgi:hypothetical protein
MSGVNEIYEGLNEVGDFNNVEEEPLVVNTELKRGETVRFFIFDSID